MNLGQIYKRGSGNQTRQDIIKQFMHLDGHLSWLGR